MPNPHTFTGDPKNGFKFLYSTESLEKEANHIPEDEHLESRMMYLDLLGYIR